MDIDSILTGSIILAITGSLIYYFGKLSMPEQDKKNHDVFNYYNQGTMFTLIFILFPIMFTYLIDFVYNTAFLGIFKSSSDSYYIIIVILIIVFIPDVVYLVIYPISRDLKPLVFKNEISNLEGGKLKKFYNNIMKNSKKYLFLSLLLSFFCIMANYIWFKYIFSLTPLLTEKYGLGALLVYFSSSIFILIYTFMSLTSIAEIYSRLATEYKRYKIYLDCGMVIEGIITSYGALIEVLTDGRKININREKINYFEEIGSYYLYLIDKKRIYIAKKK